MDATLLAFALLLNANSSDTKLPSIVGTWKVFLSQEVRDVAAKTGMALPIGKLKLKDDKSFEYSMQAGEKTTQCVGQFEFKDGGLLLTPASVSEAWPQSGLHAQISGDSMTFDGLKFAKLNPISMAGQWLLRSAGEDCTAKITFGKNGSFEFRGANFESKGKFLVEETKLTLLYTEVDGSPVKEGTMKKTLNVDEDGRTFRLDKFEYVKQ